MRRIQVLHIEPTDVCQAACAMCAREIDPAFRKDLKHHLRLEQIQQHFSDRVIGGLDKMFMCGNYGDPAAGYYTLDIYRYFRQINANITLGMNTNGAVQSTFWWHNLGQILQGPQDYCVFSIDGLKDTNQVYRKNVSWDKLIANIKAFIAAGGRAHWDMLVYRHNQHQVEACEQLAQDLGFCWFRAKVSKRGFTDRLQAPQNWQLPATSFGKIKCHALEERSMYIDAQGRVSACCWLGSRQQEFVKDDLKTVRVTWRTDQPNPVCASACSTTASQTLFLDQWQRETEFSCMEAKYDN